MAETKVMNSFVAVSADSDFTIYNIPFGVFSTSTLSARPATRIGDYIVDLSACENAGLFNGELFSKLTEKVFNGSTLNSFMGLTKPYWREVRNRLQ